MRRHRTIAVALTTLALSAAGVLAFTGGSSAKPTPSQELFKKTLLADERTAAAIKGLLMDRGGFVASEIEFTDLTGDGRTDAIVLVETGGVAGAVALYVFSTDGEAEDSDLRAVYRSQRLYRATAEVADATLILRTPRYAAGDDLCCPIKVVERTYVWSAAAKTLRQRSSQEVPGPT